MRTRGRTTLAAFVAAAVLTAHAAAADEQSAPTVERWEKPPACPPSPSSTLAGYDPETGAFLRTADGRWLINPYGMVQLQNANAWSAGRDASNRVRAPVGEIHPPRTRLRSHAHVSLSAQRG